MTKNKSIGAIQRLKMRGGLQETQTEDKSIQTSLGTINLCPSFTLDSTKEYFKNLLKDSIRPDLKPKDKTITTELEFYRDVKPNSKGTYINDFNIKVNNEDMPFTSRDQVDYFLKNYVGMVENQKLIEQGETNVKEPKYFFNKIVRKMPHYPFDQNLEDIKKELTEEEKLKGGKRKTRKNKIQRGGLPAEEVRHEIRTAIYYGEPQRVRELIQSAEGDFDINHEYNGGFTLLSIAADKGRADIVKVLLQNGADPNRVAEIDIGRSSLKVAAIGGHMDVVEVLLESGANVRQLDLYQRSSIWYAIDNQKYVIARRLISAAFEQAAVNGNVYTVENAIQDRVLSIPPLKRYFYENYAIYNSDNVPNRPLPTLTPNLKDEVASYVGGKLKKSIKHRKNRKNKKNNTKRHKKI